MRNSYKKRDERIRKKSGVFSEMWDVFKKRRRLLINMYLVSVALTLASLAIVGTQLFYPFHMVIGVSLYIATFVPFGYRLYLSRDTWQKYKAYGLVSDFVKKERRRMFLAALLLLFVAIFLWLRPLDERPFSGLTTSQMSEIIAEDLYKSVTAMDYLETTGNELLNTLQTSNEDTNGTEDISKAFTNFLNAVAYSESLTDTHRYFSTIPYKLWNDRLTSFLISYSLYSKKYEMIQRIIIEVSDSEHKKKALNQFNQELQKNSIYNEMALRFYHPKTRVRLSGGYLYSRLFIGDVARKDNSFTLLRDKAYASYEYLAANFNTTIGAAPKVVGDSFEKGMFEAWFPIQKGVATAMGRAILSTRGNEGLIEKEDALKMEKYMLPGDIMLQRRNWHVSNVGIPGFWTHSALYIGDLEELDTYFLSEFPYQEYEKFSDLLEAEYPEVYGELINVVDANDPPAVIEAIEPGVVIQTLSESADADFVAVLRPSLTKQDMLLAIIKAFSNFSKPYDFNFDFDTRDAMVCSELIYDAYYGRLPDKNGLYFETSVVNGRQIVSPFDMAQKFVEERNASDKQLEFVYLLMSNEQTKEVKRGRESDFVDSLNWSKFSFLQSQNFSE